MTQPPFFTLSTCLRSPSVAVSIAPFIARLSTKPGSGTDRSMVMSKRLGLVPVRGEGVARVLRLQLHGS